MFTVMARRMASVERYLPTHRHDSTFGLTSHPLPTGDLTERALIDRSRRRSLGFLDWEQETWSCFLVTFVGRDGQWHGHVTFRPQASDGELDEVRTADIFIEASEAEIDHKARGLGRPLFRALLSSAIHTRRGDEASESPKTRRWFKNLLRKNSQELSASAEGMSDTGELRSLYPS